MRDTDTFESTLSLSVAAENVSATVDSASATYGTTLDWTERPVRLQLRTKTVTTGPTVAATFDDVSVRVE